MSVTRDIQPFDLNLRHLRALIAIVEHGSMSAAADKVSISQPALTQGLGKLEHRLGVSLFDRRSNGMHPTAAGVAVVERVRCAMALIAAAVRDAGRTGSRGFARPEHLITGTQLRALVSLFDAGSLVDASLATGLSPPTLHRAIRDLEELCGAALVERRGRRITVTLSGQVLARGARLAAAEIAAAIIDCRDDGQSGDGRIAIGAMPLSRAEIMPDAIVRFLHAAPAAKVDVLEGSWRELVQLLRDGVIDFMLGALRDPEPPDLQQTPLLFDNLRVFARKDHPLSKVDKPSRAQLQSYPWIIGRAGTPLRSRWEAFFDGMEPPASPVECGSVSAIRRILSQSDFLTLLSPSQVRMETEFGLLACIGPPIADADRKIGICTRRDWRPNVTQRQFLEILHAAAPAPSKE